MTSQIPSVSSGMKDVYDTILPLFIPSVATFTGPLLDRFLAAHDPLMESNTLFTNRTDVAAVRVDLDGAGRILAREPPPADESQKEKEGGVLDDTNKLLEEVKARRLRMKLREQSGSVSSSETAQDTRVSRASVLKAARERQVAFDIAIAAEEEEDVADFKRRLREAVLVV